MTESSATMFSHPSLELLPITKTLPRHVKSHQTVKQVEEIINSAAPPPPTEEVVDNLNRIGREYPFCVYYKQKGNDPL